MLEVVPKRYTETIPRSGWSSKYLLSADRRYSLIDAVVLPPCTQKETDEQGTGSNALGWDPWYCVMLWE
jgi:hypothetical protein